MSLGKCFLGFDRYIELLEVDIHNKVALVNSVNTTYNTRRRLVLDLVHTKSSGSWFLSYDSNAVKRTVTTMRLHEHYFKTGDLYNDFYHALTFLEKDEYLVLTYNHGYEDFHVLVYADDSVERIKFIDGVTKEELFSVKYTAVVKLLTYMQRLGEELRPKGFKVFHLVNISKVTGVKKALKPLIGETVINNKKAYILSLKYSDNEGHILVTFDFSRFYKQKVVNGGVEPYFIWGKDRYPIQNALYSEYSTLSFKEPLNDTFNPDTLLALSNEKGILYAHLFNSKQGKLKFKLGKKNQKFRKIKVKQDAQGFYVRLEGKKVLLPI